MFRTISKSVAAAALAAGLLSTVMVPVAAHASTSQADITRRHVCAQDVYVRDQPGGVSIGLLLYGETFDVEGVSGAYFYGMAYGHVNKHGWVLGTALCPV